MIFQNNKWIINSLTHAFPLLQIKTKHLNYIFPELIHLRQLISINLRHSPDNFRWQVSLYVGIFYILKVIDENSTSFNQRQRKAVFKYQDYFEDI